MEEEEEFYLDELQIIWCDQVRLLGFFFNSPSFPSLEIRSAGLGFGYEMIG